MEPGSKPSWVRGVFPPASARGIFCTLALLFACGGQDLEPGTIEAPPRRVAPAAPGSQVLFGDLHVHTTYSIDAFLYALPLFSGEGVHPPADACDFARHCSQLDFFSINDHAEGLTPERWERTVESIRECNARASDPAHPDLVAFLGWEWTQVGTTPATHFGHKNVLFPGLADGEIPTRPISSLREEEFERQPPLPLLRLGERTLPRPYSDFVWWIHRLAELENCPEGRDVRDLPPSCRENAATPRELFAKLAQWGLDFLVIPHGLAWGVHAPPGARLDNQLAAGQHDPTRQRLLEVYSGHGNGEVYRSELDRPDPDPTTGDAEAEVCEEPTADFLPCCWRAGEIMRERCGDLEPELCEARVREARRLALAAGTAPHLVFPDTRAADWLDCDQCRDCFKPVFAPRAGESAQYSLALSRPAEPGAEAERPTEQLRWGFIASSDDHHARPGTGYKQVHRKGMSDARGFASPRVEGLLRRLTGRSGADPREPQPAVREVRSFGALLDVERTASFLYPGGLVAVHSEGRSREAVWDALVARRVYGTSGPRILLDFELLNGPDGAAPMGSEVRFEGSPRFGVRATGAFEQRPGCPEESVIALGPDRLEKLCRGECLHPGDRRHPIVAIEVIRVRPQLYPDEPIEGLIEDPWRRFECDGDPAGCSVEFEDESYLASGRAAAYYVRALQEETPAVNGANLRAEFDASGNVLSFDPCYGDARTPRDDDCLAPVHERAWSSPIWLDRIHGS
ncbi:MAG: DUF3604 domain-containing protein [Myxococcota bacterium]